MRLVKRAPTVGELQPEALRSFHRLLSAPYCVCHGEQECPVNNQCPKMDEIFKPRMMFPAQWRKP